MTPQRIAISGSSGLVGTALIKQLKSDPFSESANQAASTHSLTKPQLFLLKRSSKSASRATEHVQSVSAESKEATHWIEWEPTRGVANLRQLENMDTFIHLAGRSIDSARWTREEKARLRDSRVLATQRLVEQIATLESKPRLFLGASAVGIYGDCGDRWLSETQPASHDFLGQLAYDWEEAAKPLQEFGIRLVHARFGVVLSKHGGALKKVLPLFRSGLGGRLGTGTQFMSWIGLDDCVRSLIFLLRNQQASGAFNLVSPRPVTNLEFTQAIGKSLRRPTLFPAPRWALRAALGEMADALLLSSCRAIPGRLQELGFEFQHPDLLDFMQHELT